LVYFLTSATQSHIHNMSDWSSDNNLYVLIAAGGAAILAALIFLGRRQKKVALPQEKFPRRFNEEERTSPQPILKGIKVVELATVVAVPSIASAMARMGAEVVKIEGKKGDYW
jgi:hypothetical protein